MFPSIFPSSWARGCELNEVECDGNAELIFFDGNNERRDIGKRDLILDENEWESKWLVSFRMRFMKSANISLLKNNYKRPHSLTT